MQRCSTPDDLTCELARDLFRNPRLSLIQTTDTDTALSLAMGRFPMILHRRHFLALGLATPVAASAWSPWLWAQDLTKSETTGLEDLMSSRGGWDDTLYRQLLGAANDFKEGDEIVGVAARNSEHRAYARSVLLKTRLKTIDQHPPHLDELYEYVQGAIDGRVQSDLADWTFTELRTALLTLPEKELHRLKSGLSSDVISVVVRLMSNEQLIQLGSRLFNTLPGTRIGARGYMGARIQPNSPTDHPDDIRWQVFNAFAYGVGDVLIGTNPVSSEPESVAKVERCLQDILQTFDLVDVMPHCVLSHIDVQAQVESEFPGTTALWFQSIAGNDSANQTFDVSVEKMREHARARNGRFGLYFETGQGADFTNGHGHGVDMVTFESRKYGFARALTQSVAESLRQQKQAFQPWVHLNDVAGFIGPEVFRTKEQLVRCCLEDIAMGKLHGLTIGLDICSTLHMDVSLDDLGWCIDQIMPANPAYLMALPTRIDPMLGYLTTGYQDHVHIRNQFGYRVDDQLWNFYQRLQVVNHEGEPGPAFGDPAAVYVEYCRRKQDGRSEEAIRAEARKFMSEVRDRGVFLTEGHGERPEDLQPELQESIQRIYREARVSIWKEMDPALTATIPAAVPLATQSADRTDYILHPSTGEELNGASLQVVEELAKDRDETFDVQVVVSDGLNAIALTEDDQLTQLLGGLKTELTQADYQLAPETLVVTAGRVRAGYRIGEVLFGGRQKPGILLHIIGERPGTGHHTLSIYMTVASGKTWGRQGAVDHNITRVVSGIASTALKPTLAAGDAVRILKTMAVA
jgi:ethanolamine ammonia-lyase large subunit